MPHRIPPTLSATPRPLGHALSALHLASQLTEARRCLIALNGEAGFLAESDVYRAVLRNMSATTDRSVLQCVHAMLTTAAEDLPPHDLGIFTLWICGAAAELLDPSAAVEKTPVRHERAIPPKPPNTE